jgi:hypothetical protein
MADLTPAFEPASEPSMTGQQKRAWEHILKLREFYGAYNHQKENIAYLATALYLTGATTVVSGTFWTAWPRPHQAALAIGVLMAAALAIMFVWWQFEQRLFATAMVAACTDLAARWIIAPPPDDQLQPRPFHAYEWPAALVDRVQQVRGGRGHWVPRVLTVSAMLLWTAAAIARIVENCP